MIISDVPEPSSHYRILSPRALSFRYAYEVYELFFSTNTFQIYAKDLQVLLGEDGISEVYRSDYGLFMEIIPYGNFDIRLWLRRITVDLEMEWEAEKLPAWIGTLLGCHRLRMIDVILYGGRPALKRAIGGISDAFTKLAEKPSVRLHFMLDCYYEDDEGTLIEEEHIGGLNELEEVAYDTLHLWGGEYLKE